MIFFDRFKQESLIGLSKNMQRNPALEEIGARTKLFEFNSLGTSGSKFIEWFLKNCSKDKVKPYDVFTKEAIEVLLRFCSK